MQHTASSHLLWGICVFTLCTFSTFVLTAVLLLTLTHRINIAIIHGKKKSTCSHWCMECEHMLQSTTRSGTFGGFQQHTQLAQAGSNYTNTATGPVVTFCWCAADMHRHRADFLHCVSSCERRICSVLKWWKSNFKETSRTLVFTTEEDF